jgi:hypothetical protein
MKKITFKQYLFLVLFGALVLWFSGVISISAFNYDQALVDLWNKRPDLQKAFPGSPIGNTNLEKWASKYGWKENANLFSFYPDKKIVENIIDSRVADRIKSLESQIVALNKRVSNLEATPTKVGTSVPSVSNVYRAACINRDGTVVKFKTALTDIWAEKQGRSPVYCGSEEELVYFLIK